jgi:hypothetical protein
MATKQNLEYLGDKLELQAILETATNAALATGNSVFYDILRKHNVKGQLLDTIRKEGKPNGKIG